MQEEVTQKTMSKGKPPLCSSKIFPVWAETILRSDG